MRVALDPFKKKKTLESKFTALKVLSVVNGRVVASARKRIDFFYF